MPRLIRRRPLRWGALAGAAGALLALTALSGCPGDIDPSIKMPSGSGTGGSGSSGTGGTSGGGDCTGGNSGDQIVAGTCATSGCHGGSASTINLIGAGLDLTVNSTIGSRLVGVTSPGKGGSMCGGNSEPYLTSGTNPATGLLIDKISQSTPPCGFQMPSGNPPLTADQQQCVIQWATTLTSP